MPPAVTALLACALVFDAFCLVRLVRSEKSSLPKWVWALIICVSCPWGGLAYLVFGRAGDVLQAPELPGPLQEPPDAFLSGRRTRRGQPGTVRSRSRWTG